MAAAERTRDIIEVRSQASSMQPNGVIARGMGHYCRKLLMLAIIPACFLLMFSLNSIASTPPVLVKNDIVNSQELEDTPQKSPEVGDSEKNRPTTTPPAEKKLDSAPLAVAPPKSETHFLDNPNIKKVNPDDLECIPDAAALNTSLEQKFTIVMPTFNRKTTLSMILKHYLSMKKLDKLILVWFKEEGVVPKADTLVEKPYSDRLIVKQIREDNLMLRFLPLDEIQTQAVFSVDDDMEVKEADVYKAFEVWKKFPQGMVGWFMRLHHRKGDGYHYVWNPKTEYSIILTNAGFYHKKWNTILINQMPGGIKDLVKRWVNCEDIALNFLISSHCGEKGGIYIKPKTKPNHFSQLKKSLSGRGDHQKQRDECVTYFIKHYTRDPLQKKTVKHTIDLLKAANV